MTKTTCHIIKPEPDSSVICIRPAQLGDRAMLCELGRQEHEESLFCNLTFSETKFNDIFAEGIRADTSSLGLVAEYQQQLVGFMYCTLGEYFIAQSGLIVSVNITYIKHDLRQTLLSGKLALRLVHAIRQWAKANQAAYIVFYATSGIRVSQTDAFFRKLGLTTLGGNYAVQL